MPNYFTLFSTQIVGITLGEEAWLWEECERLIDAAQTAGEEFGCWWEITPERTLWLHHAEDFTEGLTSARDLIQSFLAHCRPAQVHELSYALTCDRPVVDAFGGGTITITAQGWQ